MQHSLITYCRYRILTESVIFPLEPAITKSLRRNLPGWILDPHISGGAAGEKAIKVVEKLQDFDGPETVKQETPKNPNIKIDGRRKLQSKPRPIIITSDSSKRKKSVSKAEGK